MAYVKFNDQNISEVYVSSEQEDDGWYEVPQQYEGIIKFKLVNGQVLPFTDQEDLQHRRDTFKSSYQNDLKINVSRVLTETDWLIQRHSEQIQSNESTSLTNKEFEDLLKYRSDLRSLSNEDLYPEEYVIPSFPLLNRYSFFSITTLESLNQIIPQELIP
jgi:CMP-N-acetylneuraminic acid synthetase